MIDAGIELVITPINKTNLCNRDIYVTIEGIVVDNRTMIISSRIPLNHNFFYSCAFNLHGALFVTSIIKATKYSIAFHRHVYEVDLIGLSNEEISTLKTYMYLERAVNRAAS